MNINNGKTGNVNIPGPLHSTGGDGDGQVGGVVAYAGDIYDTTLGKNQSQINQEFSKSLSSSSAPTYSAGTGISISNNTISVDATQLSYNDLLDKPSSSSSGYITYSEEEGYSLGDTTTASGENSFAEGLSTAAYGNYSHAEGHDTTATGNASHAEGNQCSSYGSYSHAEGKRSDARAEASHAEGDNTKALGSYSHAEGSMTKAEADKSHVEGYNTNAEGENSHAEGSGSHTIGNAAHAEGSGALAEGVAAHAEGYNTEAKADKSHAEGELTHAIGETSHVEGYKTFATYRSHAEGSQVAAIGGHAEGTGSNVGQVVTIQSVSDTPNTLTIITTAIPVQVGDILVRKDGSSDEVLNGMGIKILELLNQEGTSAKTDISTSIPMSTGAYYKFTPALGGAFGSSSHSEGRQCAAVGDYGSHAEGYYTTASGESSHTEGKCTQTTNEAEHASGKFNKSTPNVTQFSVGIGADEENRANAYEVTTDGKMYVKGVGGYDGTNVSDSSVDDLATAIAQGGGGAGTSPSGGISQSPQSGTNLSPSRTSTTFDQSTNHDKLVPAEVSTSLGQNSACSGKDTYSTGVSSFASGDNVLAKGDNSAAFGEGSFAFGDGSISVGVNDVMPCYIYVSEDSSYTGGSPRRYDVLIQPAKSLLNYDKEEVLDNMIIAIMPNHINNVVDGIVYAQLFDVYFDIDAQHNRFDQYMHAKVYISDEDREVPYDGQLMTHTIGESEDAYYGLLCRSANGKSSATIGKNLMTSNEGEVAVGNSNVSHKKQTNLAGTIFSVGARGLVSKAERSNTDYDEWALAENYDPQYDDDTTVTNVNAFFNTADCSSPSNALEVLDDGKVFIRGIGGFNGLNSTTSGVKSVQEVIADLTLQIAALTNN